MDASGFWTDPEHQGTANESRTGQLQRVSGFTISLDSLFYPESPTGNLSRIVSFSNHLVQSQEPLTSDQVLASLNQRSFTQSHNETRADTVEMGINASVSDTAAVVMDNESQPSLEKLQMIYYQKGIAELDKLMLVDHSPLANWVLSSFKPGNGLKQLRNDSPDTFWQLDGSNNQGQLNSLQDPLVSLSLPHLISINFGKRVSLERVSLFMNYQLDESYTPNKIQIMAGSFEGYDMLPVCTVSFDKPVGWLHIIFNRIRNDGVLKCFILQLLVLSNHQDGKDLHIRAIRCYGKNPALKNNGPIALVPGTDSTSVSSELILDNVQQVIGVNTGFSSVSMSSTSRVR